jgi:malate dehydrogenase
MKNKITVVGAGNVGATTAQRIFDKGYSDVVLIDIVDGLPQGKALDIQESGPISGSDAQIIGSNDYKASANSDIVVITSGIARKPGMSRDDLLLTNMKIVTQVVTEIVSLSPDSILIPVTNPLDAMAYQAYKISGFPSNRVVGMAGILDTSRFRTFISQELEVSVSSISTYVLGGHGDTMVPLIGQTIVGGKPIAELIPADRLEQIVQRARDGGAEIVDYLKTGSAYYAPSASVVQMIESILFDKNEVLPCTAYLEGEYEASDVYAGVPVVLGQKGVERIVEFKLTEKEKALFAKSVDSVRELISIMGNS